MTMYFDPHTHLIEHHRRVGRATARHRLAAAPAPRRSVLEVVVRRFRLRAPEPAIGAGQPAAR